MNFKGPESSRRSGRKRLRLRLCSARSRLQWRHRRYYAQTRSSLPLCAAPRRLRLIAYSRSLRVKSECCWAPGLRASQAPLPSIHSLHSADRSSEATAPPCLLTHCEVGVTCLPNRVIVRKTEFNTGGSRAWNGTWHRGHPGQVPSHLYLEASSQSHKARAPHFMGPPP